MVKSSMKKIQIEIDVTPEMIKAFEWNNYGFDGKPLEALATILKHELQKDIDSTIEGYLKYGKK
jgi:hypothetical protein